MAPRAVVEKQQISEEEYYPEVVTSKSEPAPMADALDLLPPGFATEDGAAAAAALETSELRWFGLGLPPRDVVSWFSAGGTVGTTERRSDIYQVNGRHDLGLKRRFGWITEAKVRHAVGPTVALGTGLRAPLEEWRKWIPAAGDPVWPAQESQWIKIHKAILTRTFMLTEGEVVGPASHADEKLSGCDVEIAAVTIGGIEAWTFAFEAFGPQEDRRAAILSSWEMLAVGSGVFSNLGESAGHAAGYPEWLDLIVSQRVGNRSPRILVS